MRTDISVELPFTFCKLCNAIEPEKVSFESFGGMIGTIIECRNAHICITANNARIAEEVGDDDR